jgi:hypothetical protein
MYKREVLFLLIFSLILLLFAACGKSIEPVGSNNSQSSGTSTDTSLTNSADHEDPGDYLWNSADVVPVVLNESSISANTTGATVDGCKITIISGGTYNFSGTLSNGQIIVNTTTKEIVRLILNGVSITNNNNSPIYIKNSKKTIIILSDNTENYLTDGSSYVLENTAIDEPNAALYSKSDLTIYGSGSLTINGKYNDGIASIDGLIIKSGSITVNSVDDGIRGKDYLILKDGKINVNAAGDGLKSDNAEDATKGYISIENGYLNITSANDAIKAETDVIISAGTIAITSGGGSNRTVTDTETAKAIKGLVSVKINDGTFTINSADDAIHSNNYVTINGGTFNISSADDGIHADLAIKINNGDINIVKSFEGIESFCITINNGNIIIVSSDDGLNATKGKATEANDGSYLYINGGNICVNASKGDGLDSNGNIVMMGGTVVVHGPKSQPEVGTDYNGSFNISGGFLVLTGPNSGNMIEATSTSSSQYAVKATTSSMVSTSTLFHLQDTDGNNIVTFKPVRNFYYIVVSSPNLKSGSTYSIYTGGSCDGTNANGLYTGGTYNGGTQKKTFAISGKVTNVSF